MTCGHLVRRSCAGSSDALPSTKVHISRSAGRGSMGQGSSRVDGFGTKQASRLPQVSSTSVRGYSRDARLASLFYTGLGRNRAEPERRGVAVHSQCGDSRPRLTLSSAWNSKAFGFAGTAACPPTIIQSQQAEVPILRAGHVPIRVSMLQLRR